MDFPKLADRSPLRQDQLTYQQQDADLTYWKQRLQDASMILDLPTDRLHPPVQTFIGEQYAFVLPQSVVAALKTLSRQENVSLFVTLLAAFQTLLYRYTGQEDLLIGTPIIGTSQSTSRDMPGLPANRIVLRTDISGNPTFRDLLERVRHTAVEAQAHQDVLFEQIVQAIQLEPDPSRHPLFQVMFALEQNFSQVQERDKFIPDSFPEESGIARCDLILRLQEREQELRGWVEYNSALFDAASIVRLVGHWQTLLEGIIDDPDRRIADLPLLTEGERQQLLVEWNNTAADYPRDQCVHQLFEAQAERTPDAVALVFGQQQLTYRELNHQANQLAHYLRQSGVGPEVLVGLCVERSLEMVVGLLGILKAGGAYVPLDPTFPSERIAFMLEDAQTPVLVTQQHLTIQLPKISAKIVCLDTDGGTLAQQEKSNVVTGVTSSNLAYVIYTSGSTGRPKGVQILHRAVVNFLLSMQQQPGLTADDIWLAVTTLSFDIAGLELFLPLITGARVAIASSDIVTNGKALVEALRLSHATVMQATPITWRMLLTAGWEGDSRLKILCGGEALPLELAQQLLPRAASLWNLYGPTETTIWSTVCRVEPEDRMITIGRPIANTQLYILSPQLQPMPIGVAGELYIGGDGLARGYLNRPELTAERFIHHPFCDEPGARLYKTGDLARYRADGTIEHLGRLDFQVKIRGFRIELGEIEAILGQHPAVQQAVVLAREDVPGNKHLVAYVVFRAQQAPTLEELQNHVLKRLPHYMLPSAFVVLQAFPLTPNGKVDRRALPQPLQTRPDLPPAPVLDNTASMISNYISNELISIPEMPVLKSDTLLLESGLLDSLSVLKLVLFLEQQFGIVVAPEDVVPEHFETIHAICTFLRTRHQVKV